MSSHNDPVQPTPFDVVQPAAPVSPEEHAPETAVQRGTPGWVLPALGVLVLLAVLVIFWLPQSLQSDKSIPEQTATEPSATTTDRSGTTAAQPSPSASTDASPWSDAQMARLRKEAQDVLADLLELQFTLQEHGVEQWAPEAFSKVATLAAEGDALYKTRNYEDASKRYQEGLTALQALEKEMPQKLNQLVEAAQQAIESGDTNAALAALAVAALIAPENEDIAALQHRAELLPKVLPLLEQAQTAEAADDLPQAQQLLEQATKLDSLHKRAKSELQRVTAKIRDQDFNAAMSEGYAALDEGRFDSARKGFRSAAKLQTGSKEAASALQEVAAAETAQQLNTLSKQGQANEKQEQWQKAVDAYEQAQKLDRSVLFASEGLNRSRARAQLDQQFRKVIAEPQRLSDAAVAAAAEKLSQQAKQISPRGPVLTQQIDQLDTLLRQANVTVDVTLRSDDKTEVVVYKVARLGQFEQHQLTLRPGTYTALGTRNGYRDVRQTFTITHNGTPAPVTIICTDPI